ncbi:MAG: hypothetical protein Q9218_008388, partial [Villophora microphyllina]
RVATPTFSFGFPKFDANRQRGIDLAQIYTDHDALLCLKHLIRTCMDYKTSIEQPPYGLIMYKTMEDLYFKVLGWMNELAIAVGEVSYYDDTSGH